MTWQISFDQIRLQRPAAANVLSLMGTLDREGIPAELLTGVSPDEIEFSEDVGILVQYSLITRNEVTVSFSMHRLVQLTIRIWLSRQGTLHKWEAEALRLVSNSSSEMGSIMLPHVGVVLRYNFEAKVDMDRQFKVNDRFFHYIKVCQSSRMAGVQIIALKIE